MVLLLGELALGSDTTAQSQTPEATAYFEELVDRYLKEPRIRQLIDRKAEQGEQFAVNIRAAAEARRREEAQKEQYRQAIRRLRREADQSSGGSVAIPSTRVEKDLTAEARASRDQAQRRARQRLSRSRQRSTPIPGVAVSRPPVRSPTTQSGTQSAGSTPGGSALGSGPDTAPNRLPSLNLTTKQIPGVAFQSWPKLRIRAEAYDQDGDRVCIQPPKISALRAPTDACGKGRVSKEYEISTSIVARPKTSQNAPCMRRVFTFDVTDGNRASRRSIEVRLKPVMGRIDPYGALTFEAKGFVLCN